MFGIKYFNSMIFIVHKRDYVRKRGGGGKESEYWVNLQVFKYQLTWVMISSFKCKYQLEDAYIIGSRKVFIKAKLDIKSPDFTLTGFNLENKLPVDFFKTDHIHVLWKFSSINLTWNPITNAYFWHIDNFSRMLLFKRCNMW